MPKGEHHNSSRKLREIFLKMPRMENKHVEGSNNMDEHRDGDQEKGGPSHKGNMKGTYVGRRLA